MKRLIVLLLILTACSQPAKIVEQTVIVRVTEPPAPTYTPYSTYTPVPPAPTYTAAPTYTPVPPAPTYTPLPTYTQPAPPTNTPRPTNTPTSEVPTLGTRANPIPFSHIFALVMDETKKFHLCITDTIRGDEAWDLIYARNKFNDPPPPGMEYILLFVEVDYFQGPADEPLELDWMDFDVVSNGQIVEHESIVKPDPVLDISFFPGAEGGGWLAWPVYPDDPAPLLAVGLDYRGRGGFYFATQP